MAAVFALTASGGDDAPLARDITVEQASELIQSGAGDDVTILDVRTADEFAAGHVAGAVNIDVNLPGFAEDVAKLDRDAQYVVYCRSGSRSDVAVTTMEDLGFEQVHNVLGGVQEWVGAGITLVR